MVLLLHNNIIEYVCGGMHAAHVRVMVVFRGGRGQIPDYPQVAIV